MKNTQFPRLTRRDVERILDVHQQLNRARELLETAPSPVARAGSAMIMSALVLLSELYNRAEQVFLRGDGSPGAPSFQDGQADPPAAIAEVFDIVETTVVHKQE